MDTRTDGSVLAVLAAYQNNLVTSKMMTPQVVQCLRVENDPKIRLSAGKNFKEKALDNHIIPIGPLVPVEANKEAPLPVYIFIALYL